MKNVSLLLSLILWLVGPAWLVPVVAAQEQTRKIDSLRHVLQTAPADTTRAQAAQALVRRFVTIDTVQAWQYAQQGLSLARKSGDSLAVAASYMVLGNLYDIGSRPPLAKSYYRKAENLYQRVYQKTKSAKALRGLAATYVNQSNTYAWENNYSEATTLLLRAATHLLQFGNTEFLGSTYHNLAAQFYELGQFDKTLQYTQLSLKLAEARKDNAARFEDYLAMADVLLHLQRRGEAYTYLQRAQKLLPAVPHSLEVYKYYQTLGDYYLEVKEYAPAAQNYRRAIPYLRQRNELSPLSELYHRLGLVSLATRHYAASEQLFRQAATISKQIHAPMFQARELRQLAETAERRGRPTQALGYYKQHQHLVDSLDKTKTQRQINSLETKYQARQREQQIVTLRKQQQFQVAELRHQHTLNGVYLTLVLALSAAGVLGYANVRNRQQIARQTQQLHAQRLQEMEKEHQLQVTDAVLQGQEEERRRLARDLHDGLGGMLSIIKLYLASVEDVPGLSDRNAHLFTTALHHLDSAVGELRRVAHNLMPEVLLQFGLPVALQQLCDNVHQTQRLRVQCQVFGLEHPLAQPTEVAVYRIVQELVNNVIKHAGATQVLVQLMRHDNRANLVVEDNGKGLASEDPAGAGLQSIRARVAYLNGRLDIQSRPSQGTSVFIEFPAAA